MGKINLLIVEDNEKHLNDAENAVNSVNNSGVLSSYVIPDFASTKDSALEKLGAQRYHGVISDIFMPSNMSGVTNEDRELCYKALEQFIGNFEYDSRGWISGEDLPPLGVLVAEKSLEKHIPIVFCTDAYHHAYKLEPVCNYGWKNRISVVDSVTTREMENPREWVDGRSATRKNWDYALKILGDKIGVFEGESLNPMNNWMK